MMTKIEKLLLLSQNVFTVQDLATVWEIADKTLLWNTIRYYLRTQRLRRIHRGLYAVRPHTSFEVAQKLIIPSYISFYSALAVHGIVFQLYETIHSMALISKNLIVNNEVFSYHKLKDRVFFDPFGVEDHGTYRIAGPERAICDSLYLIPGFGFDNVHQIDLRKLDAMSKMYHNVRLEKEVQKIIKLEKTHAG